MPINRNSAILLAKIETTYGTDSVPTGALNAIMATEIKLSPMEGSDVTRDLDLPYLAASPAIPANVHSKLSFKVELAASGTAGTAPAWGVLMRGCACAQTIVATTSVTYSPVSDALESVTLYFIIGRTQFKLTGSRGNVKLAFSAEAIPYLEFEFWGLFEVATELASRPAVTFSQAAPRLSSRANTPTFSVGGGSGLKLKSLSFDVGNKVEPRFLMNDASMIIAEKAGVLDARVEAEALSMLNPFQSALAAGSVAVTLQHGTAAGGRVTLNVPQAQWQRPAGLEESQKIVEWPLRFIPLANAGNDQFTLVLT